MRRCSAALETVPSSATVTNVLTCRRSILILMPKRYRRPDETGIGRLSTVASKLQPRERNKEEVMQPLPLTLLAVMGLGLASIDAIAETWPTKPLRAIVPVAA